MFSRYWASARGSPSNTSGLVVRPAGHLMLQFLAITHLSIISAVVPNSKLSPPSRAETTTSLPVWWAPEQRSTTLSRSPLTLSAWCTSATPISAERPAYLRLVTAAAPVPPVLPATLITSAPALATPTAMVPMPSDETSLTITRTRAALQSWISWARSSIEYVSWCGGGEMSSMPGVPPRAAAMSTVTLGAGSWPPSPGLAP